MTLEDATSGRIRHANCVITSHIPHDASGPEVALPPQMEDFRFDVGWRLVGRWFWNGFGVDQPIFSPLLIDGFLFVKTGSAIAKVAAGLRRLSYLFSIGQHRAASAAYAGPRVNLPSSFETSPAHQGYHKKCLASHGMATRLGQKKR